MTYKLKRRIVSFIFSHLPVLHLYSRAILPAYPVCLWYFIFSFLYFFRTGTIAQQISGFTDVRRLLFDYNHLTGIIPTQIIEMKDLEHFSLSHNNLSGSIPFTNNGELRKLLSLDLSFNDFTSASADPDPNIAELSSIEILNLESNINLNFSFPPAYTGAFDSLLTGRFKNTSIGGLNGMFCGDGGVVSNGTRNDPNLLAHIEADCKGDNPVVQCDCCALCCEKGGVDCVKKVSTSNISN